jgi:hypothetical protein
MIARNEKGQLAETPFSVSLLTEKANELHRKVGPACRSALKYARECGDVLVSLRKEFPLHGKTWRLHIEEHFDASYETARIYMRIAKKWADPRLVETPRHGLVLKSVKQVFSISKCEPNPNGGQSPDKPAPATTRQDIRQGFVEALQQLSSYELELFATEFNYYWVKIRKMLYRDTSRVLGQDLDEFLLAELRSVEDLSTEDGWQVQEVPPKEQEEKERLLLKIQYPAHEEGEVREKSPQARSRKQKRAVGRVKQEAAVDAATRRRALETAKQRKKRAERREEGRPKATEMKRKKKKTSVPKKAKKKSVGKKAVTKRKTTSAKKKAKKKTTAKSKVPGKKTLKKKRPSAKKKMVKKKSKAKKKPK